MVARTSRRPWQILMGKASRRKADARHHGRVTARLPKCSHCGGPSSSGIWCRRCVDTGRRLRNAGGHPTSVYADPPGEAPGYHGRTLRALLDLFPDD